MDFKLTVHFAIVFGNAAPHRGLRENLGLGVWVALVPIIDHALRIPVEHPGTHASKPLILTGQSPFLGDPCPS